MKPHNLVQWSDIVKLHPDVESGNFTEAIFAIDLGAIAHGDENVPLVYKNADAFFRSTYLTTGLCNLLEEVLASLDGQKGFNRVLKLRSPFGGGKSHTLAALLHAARDSSKLVNISEVSRFAQPKDVAVAVFDGEKFDAQKGKKLADGQIIRTMWGWIAWQIDPNRGYCIVEGHDQDRVAPGGDTIKELLEQGANGRPVLILLDEVLKYLERSAGVTVQDSTLQRQTMDFFQNLTTEVAGSKNAAMVYSLIWSAREALGNVVLLNDIDKLASRVDQLHEPVTGDEVLEVLKRRLLAQIPDQSFSDKAAAAYSSSVSAMRSSYATTTLERDEAKNDGAILQARIRASYPFHPALIDIMCERWTSVEAFQRTRGSLRFLASCMRSVKQKGRKRPILGPGNVPLDDVEVRVKLLKELGAQNNYDSVIIADLAGPNSRARKIDDRLAKETPHLTDVRPATQIATAIFLYSFGGLKRKGEAESTTLPSGVTENDLLASVVGPNLDSITAKSVLLDLRTTCLYLHFDGVRYCFRTEQNVTKLIEDADVEISHEESYAGGRGPVRSKVKEILLGKVSQCRNAVVWVESDKDIADCIPVFQIGYLPLEFSSLSDKDQRITALELLSNYQSTTRRYRNGIGLAIPSKDQVEPLRRSVRRSLAIERILSRRLSLRLTKEQIEQIKERQRTEEGAISASLRDIYQEVWFPAMRNGEIDIEKSEVGGRPLKSNDIHKRVLEIVSNSEGVQIYEKITPQRIVKRVGLGTQLPNNGNTRTGIAVEEVIESFFRDIAPPKLESSDVLVTGIAEGISDGTFGYCDGQPILKSNQKYQISQENLWYKVPIDSKKISTVSGFIIDPSALPENQEIRDNRQTSLQSDLQRNPTKSQYSTDPTSDPCDAIRARSDANVANDPSGSEEFGSVQLGQVKYRKTFVATKGQVYASFQAVANLASKSDKEQVKITISGTSKNGYDQLWLRNAVDEPFAEAGIEEALEEQDEGAELTK